MRWKLLILIPLVSLGCSESPGNNPGLCTLNCGNSIIGPIEGNIGLTAQPGDVTCAANSANQPLGDPLTFYFRSFDTYIDETSPTGEPREVPLPNLSVEPIVNGLTSNLPEHSPNTEARYKGIVTPRGNWCSDACGVTTFEVFALCPPAGEISSINIRVHSGSLFSDEGTVQIQTQDNI